jgi:hypothetical protein
MKSEITKRWYLILLISVLAIRTYILLFHTVFKHPVIDLFTYGIELILELFTWYAIIRQSNKLLMAVIMWSSLNVLEILADDIIRLMRETHTLRFFLPGNLTALLLIVLLVNIKCITVNKELNQEIPIDLLPTNPK